jgi:hypothetical protein
MASESALVLIDVDRIHEYIFSTRRLREMRSASALVSKINEEDVPQLAADAGGTPLVKTAGVAHVLFPSSAVNKAEGFCREASAEFWKQTHQATATGVCVRFARKSGKYTVQLPSGAYEVSQFSSVVTRARELLQQRKNRADCPSVPIDHPLFRLCELCGNRAAEFVRRAPGRGSFERLCTACSAKAKFVPDGGTAQHTALARVAKGVCEQAADRLRRADGIRDRWRDLEVELPDCFGGLAARVLERDEDEIDPERFGYSSYMAFIAADGNQVGKFWEEFEGDEGGYAQVSECIRESTEEALIGTIVDLFVERVAQRRERPDGNGRRWVVPFLPIIIGGDDVLCVAAGSYGVELAQRFCVAFEAKLRCKLRGTAAQEKRVTMSAGVVIAKHKFPASRLNELASQLQLEAKRMSRRCSGAGALDFMVVTSGVSRNIGDLRKEQYCSEGALEPDLTMRPYVVTGEQSVEKLLGAVRGLARSRFPRSKLKRLPEVMRLGRERRAEELRSFRASLDDPHRKAFGTVVDEFQLKDGFSDGATPLVDIAEIYDILLEDQPRTKEGAE